MVSRETHGFEDLGGFTSRLSFCWRGWLACAHVERDVRLERLPSARFSGVSWRNELVQERFMGAPARLCARGREDHAQDEPDLVRNGRDPSAQRVRRARRSNGSCSGYAGSFELVQKMISFTCSSGASGSARTRRYAKIRSETDEIRARSASDELGAQTGRARAILGRSSSFER